MDKKFDVVIGNPPYQEEAQGNATNQMPIYHLFMEAAYEVGSKAVLITPARFLFDAGYTPKSWNAKMLGDPCLRAPYYVPNSNELFPGTDIKGGVVVTYRDDAKKGTPIGMFTKHEELTSILHKVMATGDRSLQEVGITNDRVYRYSQVVFDDDPSLEALMSRGNKYKIDSRAFHRLPTIFFSEKPIDFPVRRVLGLDKARNRVFRWIREDYVEGPSALGKYKVALPKANGSGTFGEPLASAVLLEPGDAVSGTFITIGAFATPENALACMKYIKTKFARAMLGVLKVTQDNLARVWKYVPLQDFAEGSDIDWSKPISEIDRQLYARYGLDDIEIDFVESHVKPMV